jgi:hypothetical protein
MLQYKHCIALFVFVRDVVVNGVSHKGIIVFIE